MEPISESYILTALIAYLAGSIPFGLILVRFTGAGDLRAIGSGNIGATNVLRTGRKGIALATLFLDCGKGALPVLVSQHYNNDLAIVAGIFSVIGHIFPVWLRFKGGKGVATIIGVLLAIAWQIGLLTISIWVILAVTFRYSSLAAILSLALSAAYSWIFANTNLSIMITIIASICIIRHMENIQRLVKGTESKIKLRKF